VDSKVMTIIKALDVPSLSRRKLLLLGMGMGTVGILQLGASAKAPTSPLSAADQLAIQELNAHYFYSIDGLNALVPGNPAENWAKTFTANGVFSIVRANGSTVAEVRGTKALIDLYETFPDVATTRHWINDLVIERQGGEIRSGCYIIAMNIADNPATIVRSGLYQDRLVKVGKQWKFQSRKLILDPSSPAGLPPQFIQVG